MIYPVVFKRKRVGTIVMSSLLLVFSVIMLVYDIMAGNSIALYIIAVIVFGVSLAFNIFLSCEKTFIINEEKIYSKSIFIPKLSVKRENIKSVKIDEENGSRLLVYYNMPEFNGALFGASLSFVISKNDVDKPLDEVKAIIEDYIITENSKVNS